MMRCRLTVVAPILLLAACGQKAAPGASVNATATPATPAGSAVVAPTPPAAPKPTESAGQPASAPAAAAAKSDDTAGDSDEDDRIGAKLNAYVACINSFSERVFASQARYADWVDLKKGPTGKERYIQYGVHAISEPGSCIEGVAKANAETPHLAAVEAAASAYAATLKKLYPLLKDADDYYTQGNYKDDQAKHAQELHPQLIEGFDAFAQADHALRAELDAITDRREAKLIAELERTDGRKLPFLTRNAVHLAKVLVRDGDVPKLDALNLEAFTRDVGAYEAAVKEFDEYATAHKDETLRAGTLSSTLSAAKEFLVAAKELMRRVRDKTPYSTGEQMNLGGSSEWMVNGSPGKLIHTYNQLITASNSVRF